VCVFEIVRESVSVWDRKRVCVRVRKRERDDIVCERVEKRVKEEKRG